MDNNWQKALFEEFQNIYTHNGSVLILRNSQKLARQKLDESPNSDWLI